jgi:heptosyltransferase III
MRVLIVQLRQLGDILMITALIRQLKRQIPNLHLDVLCEPIGKQLLEHNPHVSNLHILPRGTSPQGLLAKGLELRKEAYDLAIDCQGLPKTALLSRFSAKRSIGFGNRGWQRFLYHSAYRRRNADYSALDKLKMCAHGLPDFHVDEMDLTLEFPTTTQDKQEALDFVQTWFPKNKKVAALFGVSRQSYKVWPPEKLADIGRQLLTEKVVPFLVYGPGEIDAARQLAELIGPGAIADYPMMSFSVLKEILGHCSVFCGNDGGPKHLAIIAGIPSLAVFGHVHPENWTPPNQEKHIFLATTSESRAVPTQAVCEPVQDLDDISVEAVWKRLQDLLHLQQAVPPTQQSTP